MSSPSLVPGTSGLTWGGTVTAPSAGVFTALDTSSAVINAINAVDYSRTPCILIIVNFTSPGLYTGSGASATIGGVPMSVIVDAQPADGSGVYSFCAMCLLSYDSSTVFASGDFVLTTPGTGVGGPPYVFGAVMLLRLLYDADPILNFGFGAGYVIAGGTTDVTVTAPVAALAADYAVATWCNSAVASNAGYTISNPATTILTSGSGLCNGSINTGLVPSDGAYSAIAARTTGRPIDFNGAAVLLALLRGAPPDAVFVPNIVGDTLTAGTAALVAVGLIAGVVTSASSFTAAPGIILSTNPAAGAETFTGQPVNIVISSGIPPLWTLTPNWATPVAEKLQFLTDVLPSWTAYEQRRILRIAPRRVFSFETLAQGFEKRYIENTLFGWSAQIWYLPIFPDGQRLPAPIALSDMTITCDTANRDFVNAGLAIAIQDAMTVEVFQVATVGSGVLNLAAPAAATWPIGTRLYPLRSARLLTYPKVNAESQEMFSLSIEFTLNEPCDWPAASGLPVYRTMPVLEDSPDVSSAPGGDYTREANITDSATGAIDVDDTAELGFPGNVHQWFLQGAEARTAFRSLLYLLHGRAGMIWLPSYNADLLLIEPVAPTDTTMTIEAAGTPQLAGVQNRRDIRIELLVGTVYYRRIVSAAYGLSPTEEILTIDTDLGAAIAVSAVRRISFMALSRLDADQIEISHLGMIDGIATAQARFVALNYET